MEPELRSGDDADAVAVVTVFEAARKTMPSLPRLHTSTQTLDYFRRMLTEQQSVVATFGEQVVGFALFDEEWIHHLYVLTRRNGVGTKLLNAVEKQSPGELQLWTFQANLGARRFYERHGFLPEEWTNGADNEEKLPDVRYKKRASPRR